MKVLLTVLLVVATIAAAQAQDILDMVTDPVGSYDVDGVRKVYTGIPITFTIFLQVDPTDPEDIITATNDWTVYLTGPGAGTPLIINTDVMRMDYAYFDALGYSSNYGIPDGGQPVSTFYDSLSPENVRVATFNFFVATLPSGLVEPNYVTITVDPIDVSLSETGAQLCIDTMPGGYWEWADAEPKDRYPAWSGPYCYEIVNCCQLRGDVNLNGGVDVTDLIQEITFLFRCGGGTTRCGATPKCPATADINNDGNITVSDLTYLINYLFRGGPAPVPCP